MFGLSRPARSRFPWRHSGRAGHRCQGSRRPRRPWRSRSRRRGRSRTARRRHPRHGGLGGLRPQRALRRRRRRASAHPVDANDDARDARQPRALHRRSPSRPARRRLSDDYRRHADRADRAPALTRVRSDLARTAARTLCVGFDGSEASPQTLSALAALHPAGIILFARNIVSVEACAALVARVRAACEDGLPFLVGVDQEGGRVARLRRGATEIPSAMGLAASEDEGLCERAGLALARDVRRAGATVNFAPVLDVASDPRNTVIGTRAFGDDPEHVARLGLALARGLERGGVVAVAKHFPGHGATAVDSHRALPVVTGDAAQLRSRDLVPFARAVESGIRAIMTAHVAIPALDPDGRPATLSHRLLTDVLRGELAFRGVCVTDCLEMGAIAGTIGSERAAVEALRAGADLLIVSQTLALAARIAEAIADAVHEGSLPLERLEEAVARVEALRRWTATPRPLPAADPGVGREAARRALTMARGTLPHWMPSSRVAVLSLTDATLERGAADAQEEGASLAQALRAMGVEAGVVRGAGRLEAVDAQTRVALVVSRAQHDGARLEAARAVLARRPDALLVVVGEPYDVMLLPAARDAVCTFGEERVSLTALAEAIVAGSQPAGKMPVSLAVAE
ncbi:beta-N-acetylhexosaminidase [bacterium]|nr:MAG: beta-N-acetylhexosaminidase [bacterium]